ncbi:hypothetical protein ACNKHK_11505 [Shigella flexneri]
MKISRNVAPGSTTLDLDAAKELGMEVVRVPAYSPSRR